MLNRQSLSRENTTAIRRVFFPAVLLTVAILIGCGPSDSIPAATPGEKPSPASIKIVDLSISRPSAINGETLTVATTLFNSGDEGGLYNEVVKLNGSDFVKESLFVNAARALFSTYHASVEKPGLYTVSTGALAATVIVPVVMGFQMVELEPPDEVVMRGDPAVDTSGPANQPDEIGQPQAPVNQPVQPEQLPEPETTVIVVPIEVPWEERIQEGQQGVLKAEQLAPEMRAEFLLTEARMYDDRAAELQAEFDDTWYDGMTLFEQLDRVTLYETEYRDSIEQFKARARYYYNLAEVAAAAQAAAAQADKTAE